MISPSEEKFVLVKCNSKPVCTSKGYCLKLFLLPLTSVPVSDYYGYDLIETSLYIAKDSSLKSLMESQPKIKKIQNQCIGCAIDISQDKILEDGIFSQYRNIYNLSKIYNKSKNEENLEFFKSLQEICEKNINEHFKNIISSNVLSTADVVALRNCLSHSKKLDIDKRINYLEELSDFTKTKALSQTNKPMVEVEF